MKKLILGLLLLSATLIADSNIGILSNQKYVCLNIGFLVDGKLTPTSQEEAMKYPLRFYIDDDNVMHTDNPMKLQHIDGLRYSNGDVKMALNVSNGKRYLMSSNEELSKMGAVVVYVCDETTNWTLGR